MSNAGMVLVFVCWTLTTALWSSTEQNRPAANASIALMPIYFLAYSIAYTPMLISYTVEILPYSIRAKGFSMVHMTIGIGITTNQFVNPIALKALKWKLYIVYCCWLVFELVYIFLYLVETKGKTLEETAAMFDGNEVVQNIENVGTEAAHQSRHRYRTDLMNRGGVWSIGDPGHADAFDDHYDEEDASMGGSGTKREFGIEKQKSLDAGGVEIAVSTRRRSSSRTGGGGIGVLGAHNGTDSTDKEDPETGSMRKRKSEGWGDEKSIV
ncbi:hypothetical protein FRC17_003809 [Serendipita sp. 399]|nr:hypothetical protein FRC17_003809 [Serendipita sp. 399]